MQFVYEAMRKDGTAVTDRVEASDRAAAAGALRDKGLLVMRLQEHGAGRGPAAHARTGPGTRIPTRDLILFTRQMKMLLEAGAPLVPALEAAEEQTIKPALRQVISRLRVRVEEGENLSVALASEGSTFDAVFRSMVAAGETTASLPQVFGRLCDLAHHHQQVAKQIRGALMYPCVLSVMLAGVLNVLLFFVVPRFRGLFLSMRHKLPSSTMFMFSLSEQLQQKWPYAAAAVALLIAAAVLCFRLRSTRAWLDELVLRLPLLGPLVCRMIFAKVVRVWAAMLRCHVPLLEALAQSRQAVSNAAFLRLLAKVEENVSSGGRMAPSLSSARLADPVIVSAIRVGEDNGRLSEAVDFVSTWIDEENASAVQHLTRLAEPLLLAFMGVVVGGVAMSLFIPLFDLATAAG